MARYIDADKLEKHFMENVSKHNLTINDNDYPVFLVDHTTHEIRNAPTADVVSVVRCKGCKHSYINSFSAQSGVALCKFWSNRAEGNNLVVQQDDYCSYGERKCEE